MAKDPMEMLNIGLYVGAIIAAPFVVMAIQIVRPGGKRGKLSSERTHFYEGIDPARLRALVLGRLQAENFRVLAEDPAALLMERRAQRPAKSQLDAYPYQRLPLSFRAEFQAHPQGTKATFRVQSLAYIYRDTGESEYFEAFLDYAMGKPTFRTVPPDLTPHVQQAPVTGMFGVLMPWIGWLPVYSDSAARQACFWGVVLGLTAIGTALWGMFLIGTQPTRFRGHWLGAVGIVSGVLAIASAVASFFFR